MRLPGTPRPRDPVPPPAGRPPGTDVPAPERVLALLCDVAGTERVLREPELPLYASGLLDSLATVSLIAALAEELGVEVSPAEFDRDAWATPRRFVEDVRARAARAPAR
jgi:D-alanine--poly(phosphoribitol) ligase subunit 2